LVYKVCPVLLDLLETKVLLATTETTANLVNKDLADLLATMVILDLLV